jgi:hypothetical protein
VNVSEEDARNGMRAMGMDKCIIDSMIELYSVSRKSYATEVSPSTYLRSIRKSTNTGRRIQRPRSFSICKGEYWFFQVESAVISSRAIVNQGGSVYQVNGR